ncbi:MAG: DUF4105 domain-containing protein [Planctomycetota bacterium]
MWRLFWTLAICWLTVWSASACRAVPQTATRPGAASAAPTATASATTASATSTTASTAQAVAPAGYSPQSFGVPPSPKPRTLDRLQPSLNRPWSALHARMPSAIWEGDRVLVRDVRNFDFITERDFVAQYYDRPFLLADLETVDFIVVPFRDAPALAHTMLSFGFQSGEQLVVSVEVRLEEGESYSPVLGALRQFELIYVLADERDAIRLRTEVRQDDVYLYRAQATPQQVQRLFVDILERVNQLREKPEFYDSFTNNCTTNIVAHINRLAGNTIPYQLDVLLPGYSANLAYNLGLLDRSVPFAELKQRANIKELAHQHRDATEFSRLIRTNLRR